MGSEAGPVFISYSRRDYYFAESLTFHLCRLGVPAWMDVKDLAPGSHWEQALFDAVESCAAFVLVASPAAFESPNVRAEWQRALAAGKRIVLLGWDRRVRLPPELQGCEWLDFRGRFAPALRRLVAALTTAARGAAAGEHPGRGPWLPPAVMGMLGALVLPIVGYALAVSNDPSQGDFSELGFGLGRGVGAVVFTAMLSLLLWALCGSLIQRRMGMTRLMACLAFVAAPFVLVLWKVARHGPAGLNDMLPAVAQVALRHLPLAGALAALPLCAMAALWWLRPQDMLRWMPTGKAWSRYRIAAAAQARLPMPGAAQALAAARRFHLLHDAADQPLADHLRRELAALGSQEAGAGDANATRIVLLSNHSTLAWVAREMQPRTEGVLLTVVGSAIGLAPALDWLWQRQWIDLRSWALQRPAAEQGLPGLPEAAATLRLPRPVAWLHAVLCAFAALIGMLSVTLEPLGKGTDDNLGAAQVGMLSCLVLALWAARQVARRGTTAPKLRRWLPWALLAGPLCGVWATLAPDAPPAAQPLAGIGTVLSALLAAAAWAGLKRAVFWLPAPAASLAPQAQRLQPKADWRTLTTVVLFMLLWAMVVQAFAPELLNR